MSKKFRIELDGQDIGQVLDGIECRRDSLLRTADDLETGKMPDDEFFLVEECRDAEEARWLADRYRTIIESIREQMQVQEEEKVTGETMGMIVD